MDGGPKLLDPSTRCPWRNKLTDSFLRRLNCVIHQMLRVFHIWTFQSTSSRLRKNPKSSIEWGFEFTQICFLPSWYLLQTGKILYRFQTLCRSIVFCFYTVYGQHIDSAKSTNNKRIRTNIRWTQWKKENTQNEKKHCETRQHLASVMINQPGAVEGFPYDPERVAKCFTPPWRCIHTLTVASSISPPARRSPEVQIISIFVKSSLDTQFGI